MVRNGNIYMKVSGRTAYVVQLFLQKYGDEHYRSHKDKDKAKALAFRFANLVKRCRMINNLDHIDVLPMQEEDLQWVCGVIRTECLNHNDAGALALAYISFTKDRVAEVWLPAW